MPLLGGSPRKLVVPQGAQAAHIQRRGKAGGKKLIWMALGALSVPGALRAASFHPHGEGSQCPFTEEKTEAQGVSDFLFSAAKWEIWDSSSSAYPQT